MSERINYGIDAPGVIRNLIVLGVVFLAASLLVPPFHIGNALVDLHGFWITGLAFLLSGGLMLLYSLRGKFHHRDRMLAVAKLRGDENVLDVGTGRGLLLVGAAKRLTTGRAVGLDIWKTSDLSGNAREKTEQVLQREGVAERCKLLERPAQDTGLPDASFEVILSKFMPAQHFKARRTGPGVPGNCADIEAGGRGSHFGFCEDRSVRGGVSRRGRAGTSSPLSRGMSFRRFASLK